MALFIGKLRPVFTSFLSVDGQLCLSNRQRATARLVMLLYCISPHKSDVVAGRLKCALSALVPRTRSWSHVHIFAYQVSPPTKSGKKKVAGGNALQRFFVKGRARRRILALVMK